MTTTATIKTSGSVPGKKPTGPFWDQMKAVADRFGLPGRDHESMLRYVQTLCVNFAGILVDDANGMRVRHKHRQDWQPNYGTRYWDATVEPDHDDHDCLYDLETLGLVTTGGTGLNPIVFMTAKGNEAAGLLNGVVQEHDLKRPRVERPDPEMARQEAKKRDEDDAYRAAQDLKARIKDGQRRQKERDYRKRLQLRKQMDADTRRFKGSIEVPPEDQHPVKP